MGKSTLISEMPLEDVAGISATVAASINWVAAIAFSGFMYYATNFLYNFLPRIMTHWITALVLILPFVVFWLFEKNILNKDLKEQLQNNMNKSTAGRYLQSKSGDIYRSIFMAVFFFGVVLLVWNILSPGKLTYKIPKLNFLFGTGVYLWIYIIYFGREPTFSLVIASKTAKDSGIYIPGNIISAITGNSNTALQSVNGSPAQDAETVVKELGALLTDIRQLGDLGIQKWKK
ncbi:MAG: hypothetical protein ABUK01_09775 [Leptospirales bacterium]